MLNLLKINDHPRSAIESLSLIQKFQLDWIFFRFLSFDLILPVYVDISAAHAQNRQ